MRDGRNMTDTPGEGAGEVPWLSIPPVQFPLGYLIFLCISSMDLILTWSILRLGGNEVNPVARAVIDQWGLGGAIGFKFSLMLFIVIVCEVLGRRHRRSGRRLVLLANLVSSVPVIWSMVLLGGHSGILRTALMT